MKFSIHIQDLDFSELTDIVGKLGDKVTNGVVTTQTEETPDAVETKVVKPSRTKAARPVAVAEVSPKDLGEVPPLNQGGVPFPGGAPADFAPAAPTIARPVHIPPVAQPVAAPVSAPMAAPQAAAVIPEVVDPADPAQVSPGRQQWNDACIAVVNQMKASGIDNNALVQVMANSMAEAGCSKGSKISTISDAEIQLFYPALQKNMAALLAQAPR